MIDAGKGTRRYRTPIMLTQATAAEGELTHAVVGVPVPVAVVYASVQRMSASKTALTFQMADVVGVDIEFRSPGAAFNGITWDGHDIHFAGVEDVNERGRIVRVSGYYQVDDAETAIAAPFPASGDLGDDL